MPGMTRAGEASTDAVPVFEVDEAGALDLLLGTGSRHSDDVVLVAGPLAARLATDATVRLRVAMPPPDGSAGRVALVDVETVHVADPEWLAVFGELEPEAPVTAMVALELVPRPDTAPPDVVPDPFGPDGVPGTPDDPTFTIPVSADVICLLFGRLRICRP